MSEGKNDQRNNRSMEELHPWSLRTFFRTDSGTQIKARNTSFGLFDFRITSAHWWVSRGCSMGISISST